MFVYVVRLVYVPFVCSCNLTPPWLSYLAGFFYTPTFASVRAFYTPTFASNRAFYTPTFTLAGYLKSMRSGVAISTTRTPFKRTLRAVSAQLSGQPMRWYRVGLTGTKKGTKSPQILLPGKLIDSELLEYLQT